MFPSPPDSRPPSPASTDEPAADISIDSLLSNNTLNDMLYFATPPRATARDGNSTPAPAVGCPDTIMSPAANKATQAVGFVQNEIDTIWTMVIDLEHRLIDNEMTVSNNGEMLDTLKDIPDSHASVKKVVGALRSDVDENKKRIQRLLNTVKHQKECDLVVPNVETSNRLSVLAHESTNHDPVSKPQKKCVKQKTKAVGKKKSNVKGVKRTKVKVISASMVLGQGVLVSDKTKGTFACCVPCPWSKAEGIQKRLSGIISKDDDVIVLLGGTNNVPHDDVTTCIQRINALVCEAQTLNKRAHVIISELPIRFDDVSLNSKVEKINIFIKHICTKSNRIHAMSLDNLFPSHFGRDGLHFSETGRAAFAKAI